MQTEKYDAPGSLMTRTLTLVKNDSRNLLEIHKASNLPLYWLRGFMAGHFKNPSVNRVQALYEHYTGKSLTID